MRISDDTVKVLSFLYIDSPDDVEHCDVNQYRYKDGYKWYGPEIPCKMFDRLKELQKAGFHVDIDDGKRREDNGRDNDGYARFKYYYLQPCIKVSW